MAGKKTWRVRDLKKSRHPHLHGETVELYDTFSNGLAYPGDPNGSPAETAGCNCSMDVEMDIVPKRFDIVEDDEGYAVVDTETGNYHSADTTYQQAEEHAQELNARKELPERKSGIWGKFREWNFSQAIKERYTGYKEGKGVCHLLAQELVRRLRGWRLAHVEGGFHVVAMSPDGTEIVDIQGYRQAPLDIVPFGDPRYKIWDEGYDFGKKDDDVEEVAEDLVNQLERKVQKTEVPWRGRHYHPHVGSHGPDPDSSLTNGDTSEKGENEYRRLLEAQSQNLGDLTPEELEAVNYHATSSWVTNMTLRGMADEIPPDAEYLKKYSNPAAITKALAKFRTTETFTVWRAGKPGLLFDPAFMSTSFDRSIAEEWAADTRRGLEVIRIDIPVGTQGIFVDIVAGARGMKEFLLQRDTELEPVGEVEGVKSYSIKRQYAPEKEMNSLRQKSEVPWKGQHYHPHAGDHGPDPSGGGAVPMEVAANQRLVRANKSGLDIAAVRPGDELQRTTRTGHVTIAKVVKVSRNPMVGDASTRVVLRFSRGKGLGENELTLDRDMWLDTSWSKVLEDQNKELPAPVDYRLEIAQLRDRKIKVEQRMSQLKGLGVDAISSRHQMEKEDADWEDRWRANLESIDKEYAGLVAERTILDVSLSLTQAKELRQDLFVEIGLDSSVWNEEQIQKASVCEEKILEKLASAQDKVGVFEEGIWFLPAYSNLDSIQGDFIVEHAYQRYAGEMQQLEDMWRSMAQDLASLGPKWDKGLLGEPVQSEEPTSWAPAPASVEKSRYRQQHRDWIQEQGFADERREANSVLATKEEAWRTYTDGGYEMLAAYLRHGDLKESEFRLSDEALGVSLSIVDPQYGEKMRAARREWLDRRVKLLDEVIATPLKKDTVVYRGVKSSMRGYVLSDPDAEWTDESFVSVSLDYDTARGFAGVDGHVMEMTLPAGTPVALGYSKEFELILPRGLKFRLINSDPEAIEAGDIWEVELVN